LAHATEHLDADRGKRWLKVVAARRRFAEHARLRAAEPLVYLGDRE
jgi:hypothetical protein